MFLLDFGFYLCELSGKRKEERKEKKMKLRKKEIGKEREKKGGRGKKRGAEKCACADTFGTFWTSKAFAYSALPSSKSRAVN